MDKKEINLEKLFSYDELVAYLLKKYGPAKYNYFCNEICKTRQTKNSRTKEGLFLHHIGEKEHIKLADSKYALKWNFEEYQGKDHLVYCNYLEHFLLHLKIVYEYFFENFLKGEESVGIGGIINYIGPELSTYYTKSPIGGWQKTVFDVVKDNLEDFAKMAAEFEDFFSGKLEEIDLSKTKKESEFMGTSSKIIREKIDYYKKNKR